MSDIFLSSSPVLLLGFLLYTSSSSEKAVSCTLLPSCPPPLPTQHAAATFEPLDEYAIKLRHWIDRARGWAAHGEHRYAMWMPSPLLPPRVDGFARANKDGRTLHRLSLYNEVAATKRLTHKS